MTITINRVHANNNTSPCLLDSHGLLTPFKRCVDPEAHAFATYYRQEAGLDICDICNESREWIQENLWRYPEAKQRMFVKLLGIEEMPLYVTEKTVEASEDVESMENTPDTLGLSQSVIEHCESC